MLYQLSYASTALTDAAKRAAPRQLQVYAVPNGGNKLTCASISASRHHRLQAPKARTQIASNALVVACATTASPILPRLSRTAAYSSPATAPATQRSPCSRPNASEERRTETAVNSRNPTEVKSAEISRRLRKPRNASSSAIGTVVTAAATRTTSHAMRAEAGKAARPAAIPPASCVPLNRSSKIHMAKTRQPIAGASQPNLQSSSLYSRRKYHSAAAAATNRSG